MKSVRPFQQKTIVDFISLAHWRLFFLFFLFSACDAPEVRQIDVEIPAGVQVPEDMVYIPAGKFIMGHEEEPQTRLGKWVESQAYLIDRYEVSHEKYSKVQPKHTFPPKSALYPVTHVSYAEALDYCKALDKRLPTEVEWEKAARGTDGRKWPWRIFVDHPNNGFSGFISEPVDKRKEWISPYGVYGMGHNVWEWTDEGYTYPQQPEDERELFKVIRGGLLQTHITVKFSPAYFRNWMEPESKLNFIGFRCAKDAE